MSTHKKISAAKQSGLLSRRYEFGIYPTKEQEEVLLGYAAMVRTLQNALNCICVARYLRKSGDKDAYAPYLLTPDALDDSDTTDHPKKKEMSRWVTGLMQKDARWRAMSVHVAHRVVDTVDRSWQAFFRNLKKNPELAGRPKRKSGHDEPWIPFIHLKRVGDIGSAGSGCKLTHLAGRNWQLELKGVGVIHTRGQMPGRPGKDGDNGFAAHGDESERTLPLPPRSTEVPRSHGKQREDGAKYGRFIDADVKVVCGKWKLSICCYIERSRRKGTEDTKIEFDLLDGMARVNGRLTIPEQIAKAQVMQDASDQAQASRDQRWAKRSPSDPDWRDANREVNRLKSKAALIRKNALHVWSTHIVRDSSSITIKAPDLRKNTKTARGDEKTWGANVTTVASINRNTLSYAAGMAIAMLKYKALEAGFEVEVVKDEAPNIAIGEKLVAAGKIVRLTKRAIRREDNERYQQGTGGTGRSDRRRVGASR